MTPQERHQRPAPTRYQQATDYVQLAIKTVEDSASIWHPADWYANRLKTNPARNELARIEARWLRAASDAERVRVADDAELLADRVQETLPGAPQTRTRTNQVKDEGRTFTPATSYDQEIRKQLGEYKDWATGKLSALSDEAKTGLKWAAIVGGALLGIKLVTMIPRSRSTRADGDL